jgi:hypothetical protein
MNYESTTPDDADRRFTIGLLAEITTTLEKHGYHQPTEQTERNRSTGATLEALLHLVRAFEGEAN